MSHDELPYVAFISAFLVLIPLPWHWRARNVATLAMVAWLFVINMIYGVDAIIWRNNVRITALIWCDITTRIIIGAAMALPAACMCISIHLAQVASVSRVQNSRADKRRRQIIELFLCFGLPILWMAVHYTVQGHRFDVIEYYGCRPNTYLSIPSIFLIWAPPLIFSAVTVAYSGIALVHFLRHRIAFTRLLQNSDSGLTTSRYLRLMAMAFAEIVITVVSSSLTLWVSTLSLRPWTNWADIHWNFSRVDTYPIVFVPPRTANYYYATWYIIPFSSLVFFVFFAFGQDALREYSACVAWVRLRVLRCGARKSVLTQSVKQASMPFVPLPSASFVDEASSLPSYQCAVGENIGLPNSLEKHLNDKERYAAQPIDRTDVVSISLHHVSAYSDGSSCFSTSAPPSPGHTPCASTHRHSLCNDLSPISTIPPTHLHDSII